MHAKPNPVCFVVLGLLLCACTADMDGGSADGADGGTSPGSADEVDGAPPAPGSLIASGVTGPIAPGGVVRIAPEAGTSFGAQGPQVLLFDEFEGTPGTNIPLDGAAVGAWTGKTDSRPPLYSNEIARSGTTSFLAFDANTSLQRQLKVGFPDDTEILVSYWVALPAGSRFPGNTTTTQQFSTDSSWKFAWLMDNGGYGSDGIYDQCLPSHVGNGNFYLGGNDGNLATGLGNSWWDWYEWVRISVWFRAASTNPSTNNGDGFLQTVSRNRAVGTMDLGNRPTFQGGTESFDSLNVPGWIRERGGASVRPHYDDIYVAVGPGAAARVEVGDQPVYTDCTNLAMAIVNSWTDDEIEVELLGNNDMPSFEGRYLFIHDADNQLVGSGRLISVAP